MSEAQTSFKVKWLQDQFTKLRRIYSPEELSNEELKTFLLNEYEKRKTVKGRFYNNVTKENKVITIEGYINYFLNNDYVLNGYNVLTKNQHQTKTIAIEALEYILNQRKVYKKKMEAADKGSVDYIYNKVMQLTFKILANSYYGVISMAESIFYNAHLQNSVTTTGQDLISTAIYLVESFIANNEHFRNTDEIISFVSNVCGEKNYELLSMINIIKTKEEVKAYLINHCDEAVDEKIIDKLLDKRSVEELNKVYYKNQLIELIKNKYFLDKVKSICKTGEEDPEFRDLVINICNYNHIAWDRFIRISQQTRQASLVTDTDSTFVYLGNLAHKIKNLVDDSEEDNTMNICNFLIYLITEAMKRTFKLFTDNCKIPDTHSDIINIKNEFIYSRILTTRNKKNYAGWLLSELGKRIPGDDPSIHLDMKGLSIRKSTVAKSLREEFQNMLVDDILTPEKIDVLKVMKHYNEISETVTESIKAGKTEFLIPKSVDPYTAYKNPASIEQVKSTIIWNSIEPDQAITPPDNIKLVKIAATTLDHPAMQQLKAMDESKFEAIKKAVFECKEGELDISKNGFTSLSLPLDLDYIPEYIRPLINYDLMVNANVKNANILLESLGLQCTDDKTRKTNYKSNIVEWI